MIEGLDSKDIYLKKDGEQTYIGLHAVGEANSEWDVQYLDGTIVRQKGFKAWESWGNEYVAGKMVGRGSFRVFNEIEEAARQLEEDGWVRFTPEQP